MEGLNKLIAAGAASMIVLVTTVGTARADETTYGAVGPGPAARSADGDDQVVGDDRVVSDDRVVGGDHNDVPEPERTVRQALDVFQRMRQETGMMAALAQARGVFIIPGYATASLVVGGAGGSGIMLEQRDGRWSPPAFFHIGSASLGLQAGVAIGPLAMLLMNEDAVRPFHEISNFSMDAAAGFTVVDWSALAEASAGRGDVVIWSDMTGLVVDLSVAVSNVNYDEEATSRYYGQRLISPSDVLTGAVEDPHGARLQSEFAEFTGNR
jgi:SH3 domain-containing YSC84-like protein 1